MKLEKIFGSRMQTKLLEYLLENSGRVFNQAGLARFLNCSPSTIARIIEPLIEEGILMYEQISGQMKILALNLESEKVKILLDFYEKIKKM
ncbi:winged helix-turn-helix domain-containing protein [Candidatus Bathyarchaeota archaeon]|nr:MAG: winged helix-turn-helix domain-containing protein [Candidatus Bathyarchaeota archaeon]